MLDMPVGGNRSWHVSVCVLLWLLRDPPGGEQQARVQQLLRPTRPHS